MKLNLKKQLILLFACLLFANISADAQCSMKNTAFRAGETMNYDLYYNWKFVWAKAGTAAMRTTATTWRSKPAYRMYMITTGSKKADMFFRMRDTLISVIGTDLTPLYYYKGSYEGKRQYKDEAYYNYKNGQCCLRLRKMRKGVYKSAYKNENRCVFDMLSILAQARSYDPRTYKVGQKIHFAMAAGTDVENETLIFRGKKNIKAQNDTVYRCLIFSFVEYKGSKEKEVVTFYVTDDLNHLPIRLDLFLNFGTAKAYLRSVSGNLHPFTSIVKG
jgi:hypothetical protein